ncbi:hypothetical protein RYX36_021282 [Vicia faba]
MDFFLLQHSIAAFSECKGTRRDSDKHISKSGHRYDSSGAAYATLQCFPPVTFTLHVNKASALRLLWSSNIQFNIQTFVTRFILNRLQTNVELAKWGVLSRHHNLVCLICLGLEESHMHLFIQCLAAVTVWHIIYNWLNLFVEDVDMSLVDHLFQFKKLMKEISGKKFRILIWMSTTLAIWLVRNDILFNGGIKEAEAILLLLNFVILELVRS